jgi:hypothetical protein
MVKLFGRIPRVSQRRCGGDTRALLDDSTWQAQARLAHTSDCGCQCGVDPDPLVTGRRLSPRHSEGEIIDRELGTDGCTGWSRSA